MKYLNRKSHYYNTFDYYLPPDRRSAYNYFEDERLISVSRRENILADVTMEYFLIVDAE
jgi:hypothetical protein